MSNKSIQEDIFRPNEGLQSHHTMSQLEGISQEIRKIIPLPEVSRCIGEYTPTLWRIDPC
jgi:hypothetical protein